MATILLLVSCKGDSTRADPPAQVEAGSAGIPAAVVGSVLTPAASFTVRDAAGRALGGVPVTIAIAEGGGSLRNSPTRTANGLTSVGVWTLGTHAGRNALTVTVANLPPLTIEVMAAAGPPVGLEVVAGDGQASRAGDHVAQPLSARAVDQYGNGVAGVAVSFAVNKGGGAVAPAQGVTDANGIAGGESWTLGKRGGDQQVRATAQLGPTLATAIFAARIDSDFDPVVRFFGPTPPTDIAASFTAAADRIHGLIVGDLSEITLTSFDASRCGIPGEVLNEVVDDVLIYATVTTIDGPGKILGSAGPCLIRSADKLTVLGVMRFDVDDLNNLVSSGRLEPIILHEMLHIIGVGSLWRTLNLVDGTGTADPRYTGVLGTASCNAASGLAACGPSVPIENAGSIGTVEVHWREATFDNELMTGFAEAPGVEMPLSAITASSLQDYGYAVNSLAVDPYTVPTAALRLRRPPLPADITRWEQLQPPLFDVTPAGWVRPVMIH
ncbi:MAG: Ig-like domain-containing protein [Gemmatimonadaceae bacterium]